MVRDAHFFSLNVNYSYSYNMNSVELSDQLWDMYRVDQWMRKYKWWQYLFFWGHLLFFFNAYILYKTLCEEGQVNPMSYYEFLRLVCLAKIYPTNVGNRDHLVS